MIFDSVYDIYRGVITYIRVIDGQLHAARADQDDVDRRHPRAARDRRHLARAGARPTGLGVGEVGYLITGVKDVRQSRVGDTVTDAAKPATRVARRLPRPASPMVYSGLYPIDGSDYPLLRDALDKLRSTTPRWSTSRSRRAALGFGFRCGFLGLLHLEITRDRLEREFDLDLICTAPNVVYRVVLEDGAEHVVTNPSDWPTGRRSPRSTSRSSRR